MNLFILGNGFDRAHGLPTSYMDFRDYLENKDWSYLASLEAPYGCLPGSRRDYVEKYLWREFENNLYKINEGEIIDGCMSIEMGLESGDVGIEDTLNVYWEEQYGYIQRLNDYIKSWVEQIDIHVQKKTNRIKRSTDDIFISFNYTLLLEKVYKIDKYRILHIHGSIDMDDIPPVIGHGNLEKMQDAKKQAYEAGNNFWEKESSIYNALANYYQRTLKDVLHYLSMHSYFFDKLKPVDQVYVIGHSFGEVDLPYFKKVMNSIDANAVWNVYYHNEEEADVFKAKITSIGVTEEQIRIAPSKEFFDK